MPGPQGDPELAERREAERAALRALTLRQRQLLGIGDIVDDNPSNSPYKPAVSSS